MTNWTSGWKKFTRIWRSDTASNVDDEIGFHFEQKVAEFVAQGMTLGEARTRAEAEFGDVESVRDSLRTIGMRVEKKHRRAEWWEGAAQDLKYVLRTLRRSPAFTITVIVTLALGLGANAALFSVLDQLYVQTPAGVANALQMRRVYQFMANSGRPFTRRGLSYPEIRAVREVAPAGLKFAGYRNTRTKLGLNREGPEIGVTSVEGDYFGLAGVRPELGRFFTPDESRIEGISMLAVISDALWERQYGRDPNVIGKEIDLGTHRHIVIGVAGGKFRGTDIDVADMWVPMNSVGTLKGRDPAWFESQNNNGIGVLTRVPDEGVVGVFDARATNALHTVRISKDTLTSTFLASIIEARAGELYGKELAISTRLGGVAVVILLIACANV
ncbi:MAG: ABC transporter permease, partial [Gemmatimonadaceae bacterium]